MSHSAPRNGEPSIRLEDRRQRKKILKSRLQAMKEKLAQEQLQLETLQLGLHNLNHEIQSLEQPRKPKTSTPKPLTDVLQQFSKLEIRRQMSVCN